MKISVSFIFLFFTSSLIAQIEITNLENVLIDDKETSQNVTLEVRNNSTDDIDLDWEIEFAEEVESFLEISVSDINNDYTHQIRTSHC